MSYSADTFVADEQPTTAKWNKLWSNDASFNDGTGIADNAILNRHLSSQIVTPNELNLDPSSQYVAADQTTTSVTYANLATTGPAATVTIGANGLALVLFGAGLYTTAAQKYMSVAVSGATTTAAADTEAIRKDDASFTITQSRQHLFTGLAAGSTTFTAKYRVASGTGNFFARYLIAIPL